VLLKNRFEQSDLMQPGGFLNFAGVPPGSENGVNYPTEMLVAHVASIFPVQCSAYPKSSLKVKAPFKGIA
jgi:hypothetical protein